MAYCPRCGGLGTRRQPCICPKGGGGREKKGKRATRAKCGCSCGHLAGQEINGVEQRWGGGCTGAKAGDPHAAHCGRPACGQ
jgi:hypothetical protein